MMRNVIIERGGPAVSVQDLGRPGRLGIGLSRAGAADKLSYIQGLALVDAPLGTASIECAGLGGRFRFDAETRFVLTGADMRATLNRAPVETYSNHIAPKDSTLEISAITKGVYGYLTVGGGIETQPEFDGRGYHRIAGFGQPLTKGDQLPIGNDPALATLPLRLTLPNETGPIRVMPGPQTEMFAPEDLQKFTDTTFVRSVRANRQGVRLDHDGTGFSTRGQLNQVSDFISEGDIQMTGDGTPCVLLADCQTMGGYPRIGTVLPNDLHRVAQAMAGDELRFTFINLAEAEATWVSDQTLFENLKRSVVPRIRNPHDMGDLLSYELIDRPSDDVVLD